MATAQIISMLSPVPRIIIFKVLANKGYYKLFTVCEWNNLHILKHSLSIQSLTHLLSFANHEGLLGWQAFSWLHDASREVREWLLPELVLGAWLTALESSLPCPWVCMLRPVASDLPRRTSLLRPWAGSLEEVGSFTTSRAVDLSGRLWCTSFLRPVGFAPVMVSLSFLQLQFCAVLSSFSVSRLLNWISFSAFRLNALEIISRILNPVSGQHSSYIPNPWLFTVPETWSPKVFFLPELSNKVKWEEWNWFATQWPAHIVIWVEGNKSTGQAVAWLHGNLPLKGWMFGLILDRQHREQGHSSYFLPLKKELLFQNPRGKWSLAFWLYVSLQWSDVMSYMIKLGSWTWIEVNWSLQA